MDDDRDETRFQIKVIVLCWAVVAGIFLFWATMAQAQMRAQRSTPDIAIAATSTAEVLFFNPGANWVYVKNDCADSLYFDLRPGRESVDNTANAFPLRLLQNQAFTWEGSAYSLGVSHGSASTASCTFTLMLGQ